MQLSGWLLTVCVVLGAREVQAQDGGTCAKDSRMVTEIGTRYEALPSRNVTAKRAITVINAGEGIAHVRLLLEATALGPEGWRIIVRDQAFRPVQTFTRADFESSAQQWTGRVRGSKVTVDLRDAIEGSDTKVVVKQYIAMPDDAPTKMYSVQDEANPKFSPLYASEHSDAKRRLGDSVGFLMGSASNGAGHDNWCCSAVAVTNDLVLTNWHCVIPIDPGNQKEETLASLMCKDALLDMSWDDDLVASEYACEKAEYVNRDLDIALLKVRPVGHSGRLVPVTLAPSFPTDKARVLLVHHPACRQKQLSEGKIRVNARPGGMKPVAHAGFAHDADTEGGSSGAPVFDQDGRLIGLHHQGFHYDAACRPDKLNKAVRLDQILNHLNGLPQGNPLRRP